MYILSEHDKLSLINQIKSNEKYYISKINNKVPFD